MDERTKQIERPTRRSQQNNESQVDQQQPSYMRRSMQNSSGNVPAPLTEEEDMLDGSQMEEDGQSDIRAESLNEIREVIDRLEDTVTAARKMPMSKTLRVIDSGDLIDLIGQLRIVLPRTVREATEIIKYRDQILTDAERQAQEQLTAAERKYQETVNQAKAFDEEIRGSADAYDREIRQRVSQDANNMIADANARAEQMILAAQQQQQAMVMDNEIVRRANAYALEVKDKAQKEADRIYTQACIQSDKMLSGATAALSRSANDLAQLRDSLLSPGNGQPDNGNGYYSGS